MTKSFFRTLLGLTAAVFLSATALPASAATLTYNDPNCAGFQITGSGGSFTLTCGKLACSISGSTTPTTAVGTALTATCTPVASGYLWSLVSGPFSDSTCNAPSQPTSVTTNINKPNGIVAGQKRSCLYQVNGDVRIAVRPIMVTVTWSDAPTAPPVCAPAAVTVPTPMTSAGGNVVLGAGCVPNAGVTYSWTRTAPTAGAPTNPTTANPTDTLAANTGTSAVTYTWLVVACTSPTTCDTKSVTTSVPRGGGAAAAAGRFRARASPRHGRYRPAVEQCQHLDFKLHGIPSPSGRGPAIYCSRGHTAFEHFHARPGQHERIRRSLGFAICRTFDHGLRFQWSVWHDAAREADGHQRQLYDWGDGCPARRA